MKPIPIKRRLEIQREGEELLKTAEHDGPGIDAPPDDCCTVPDCINPRYRDLELCYFHEVLGKVRSKVAFYESGEKESA